MVMGLQHRSQRCQKTKIVYNKRIPHVIRDSLAYRCGANRIRIEVIFILVHPFTTLLRETMMMCAALLRLFFQLKTAQ